ESLVVAVAMFPPDGGWSPAHFARLHVRSRPVTPRLGPWWTRTRVRYNVYMREEDIMRATDIGMVPLGYGRFVRGDEIVGVLPIEEGRGRGRRTHVHVAGLAVPIVASRSEGAIPADMKAASGAARRVAGSDERRSQGAGQAVSAAPHRRSRLGFGA